MDGTIKTSGAVNDIGCELGASMTSSLKRPMGQHRSTSLASCRFGFPPDECEHRGKNTWWPGRELDAAAGCVPGWWSLVLGWLGWLAGGFLGRLLSWLVAYTWCLDGLVALCFWLVLWLGW